LDFRTPGEQNSVILMIYRPENGFPSVDARFFMEEAQKDEPNEGPKSIHHLGGAGS